MAHDPRALQRLSTVLLAAGVKVHKFFYASNHTLAEITTDGFFNTSRDSLSKSSIIDCVADVDGTPNFVTLKVTTWSATADIVTAIDTPAA